MLDLLASDLPLLGILTGLFDFDLEELFDCCLVILVNRVTAHVLFFFFFFCERLSASMARSLHCIEPLQRRSQIEK